MQLTYSGVGIECREVFLAQSPSRSRPELTKSLKLVDKFVHDVEAPRGREPHRENDVAAGVWRFLCIITTTGRGFNDKT